MELKAMDDITLRRYLLGDVSSKEQEDLELWLMSDDDAYVLLEAAEDDLIDESLAGKLRGRELDQFNKHFLAAPERKRKVEFSRSLRRFVDGQKPPDPAPSPFFWHRFLDALRYRPALGYAISALIVLIVFGLAGAAVKITQLQRELVLATSAIATIQQERNQLQKQLAENESLTQALQSQLETRAASALAGRRPPAAPVLLAVNLRSGLVRSPSALRRVDIAEGAKSVQFTLMLVDDDYATYRVSLRDPDLHEIWAQENLHTTVTPEGKAIVVTVPAASLPSG